MSARVRGIRGATTLDVDAIEQMHERVPELILAMMTANDLDFDDIVSVVFNATSDITSGFPAAAARLLDLADTPLLDVQEMSVPGSLPRAVRVLMHVYTERSKVDVEHVYLRGADILRPDLTS